MYMCIALGGLSTYCIKHNFQRRMSRLEQRWRAQRSVISIVNCRIPWINRDLNVHCAFGISLKACLLQSLLYILPAVLPLQQCAAAAAHICVSRALVALGACRTEHNPGILLFGGGAFSASATGVITKMRETESLRNPRVPSKESCSTSDSIRLENGTLKADNFFAKGSFKCMFNIGGSACAFEICDKTQLERRKFTYRHLEILASCSFMMCEKSINKNIKCKNITITRGRNGSTSYHKSKILHTCLLYTSDADEE